MHYSNSEANAAAERELDRDLNSHLDDYEAQFAPTREYRMTLTLVINAQNEEQAIESLHGQFKSWLGHQSTAYDIYDIEIQSAEEM